MLRADAEAAGLVLHSLLAAKVLAGVVVDVVHVVHRSGAPAVLLVGDLERLVATVAVLHDIVLVVEQIDADNSGLAQGDALPQSGHVFLRGLTLS